MTDSAPVLLADSVTALSAAHTGCVLVAGSHGGVIAARYVAHARVRSAVFNDAGIGCDEAGVAGLAWLETRGVAAAAVAHDSARIGSAADSLSRGRISRANAQARELGVAAGQDCTHAAQLLRFAAYVVVDEPMPSPRDGRHALQAGGDGTPQVVGLDSIGLVEPGDAGMVLVIGSHGGLHGGDPASALAVAARAAFFHDAGVGIDEAGTTRLPALAARNLPAGAVDYRSARIGDARSMWATGILSRVNVPLAALGVGAGVSLADALALLPARGASARSVTLPERTTPS